MSFIRRTTTAFFTALPAFFFFLPVVTIEDMRKEYYWISILAGASVLLGSALFLGFFQPVWLRPKWMWIMAAGFAALLMALFVTTIVDATPLCVGQDNGDGNNSFGMCMGYVMLYAFFYGIPYMVLLTVSAGIGHWVLKRGVRL
jgi:hypothetical protein